MASIKILDTTLRDGEQSPGCSMNLTEKIEIARNLQRLGVDIIETGFAAASPGDLQAVKTISGIIRDCSICSLARATQKDIDIAWEGIRAAVEPRIHIFLATSPVHMKYKLKMSPDDVIRHTADAVKYAKIYCSDIEFSAEDAGRSDWSFLVKVFETAIKNGATVLNVPDTVGYMTPEEIFKLFSYLKNNVKGIENVTLSTHNHDDLGLATANTLAAIRAGARQAELTINGIGERAGNASLEEVVMSLETRKSFYNIDTNINTRRIYRTSRLVQSITGFSVPPNKAIVGSNAFAHEAGIHQHGMMASRETYEIMTPESVGIPETLMVLGKHSGRHAVEDRLEKLGYHLSPTELDETFEKFKNLADKKKIVMDRDLEALISSHIIENTGRYSLVNFVINSGNTISSTAIIKLNDGEKDIEHVEIGDGPVDASFKSINAIIDIDFKLESYKLNSVTGGEDALGEATVRLSKDNISVSGRGLSTDVIEASIKAYINGVNNYLEELQ